MYLALQHLARDVHHVPERPHPRARALFAYMGLRQTTVIHAAYDPNQCVSCLPGTQNCEACVIGEYQNLGGQVTCLECPAGHFCPTPTMATPTPCAAGTYMPEPGRTVCLACDAGLIRYILVFG